MTDGPELPPGRSIELPGRGTTFIRELPGPEQPSEQENGSAGAPTVLLLHGWTASADLNWFAVYRALGEHYRVVALDHRGHGRGIRSRKVFRLDDVMGWAKSERSQYEHNDTLDVC